jgi:uncharacterized repeat protein (TIGR03803 family)
MGQSCLAGPGKLKRRGRVCAVLLFLATTGISLSAQTFTTLFTFDTTDGSFPVGLVQATNGDLYGTTTLGGVTSAGGEKGAGTVFKITLDGTLTTLHSFCQQISCPDGYNPAVGLVQASDGNLYGTTSAGGANNFGTVFKITLDGTLTTLHSFNGTDGEDPEGALVQATNGDLYGTTYYGGTNAACSGYCGTVFKITLDGILTTLHSFNGTDGQYPEAALIQATNGDLYGTTYYGGTNSACPGYCGTVFKITPSGSLTSLYSFCSQSDCTDGRSPFAGLVQGADGNLYGTTAYEGAYYSNCKRDYGCGTVFKITPDGVLTTLYSFDGTDGEYPDAALVQATNGDLYGTTIYGGVYSECKSPCGTVFRITPGGALTMLHRFNLTNGAYPLEIVQATDGNLYGVTEEGGKGLCNCGTIYRLSEGLGPFVETQTTSGKVGAAVKILGTDLIGATSVTFNGTAATFTVASKSEITTKVPQGATTGAVRVVTPDGTLSSNQKFRVTP